MNNNEVYLILRNGEEIMYPFAFDTKEEAIDVAQQIQTLATAQKGWKARTGEILGPFSIEVGKVVLKHEPRFFDRISDDRCMVDGDMAIVR